MIAGLVGGLLAPVDSRSPSSSPGGQQAVQAATSLLGQHDSLDEYPIEDPATSAADDTVWDTAEFDDVTVQGTPAGRAQGPAAALRRVVAAPSPPPYWDPHRSVAGHPPVGGTGLRHLRWVRDAGAIRLSGNGRHADGSAHRPGGGSRRRTRKPTPNGSRTH